MPASDSATATLRFAGKPLAASRARAVEDFQRLLDPLDVDLVLDEMRRTQQARATGLRVTIRTE